MRNCQPTTCCNGNGRVLTLACRFPAKLAILAAHCSQVHDHTKFFSTKGAAKKFFTRVFPVRQGTQGRRYPAPFRPFGAAATRSVAMARPRCVQIGQPVSGFALEISLYLWAGR
jgi:hypothetical protein